MNYRSAVALKEAPRIQELCRDAASTLYNGEKQPSLPYQERVARLLFMTLAHESRFYYRRQISRITGRPMSATSNVGAFGLAQCERGSIMDSVRYVAARPALGERVRRYLRGLPQWGDWERMRALLQTEGGDRLSVCLCRLHYLRDPESVPGTTREQAEYAKKAYNTAGGAALPDHYEQAFLQLWPG